MTDFDVEAATAALDLFKLRKRANAAEARVAELEAENEELKEERDNTPGPEIDMLPHFIAGVLSGRPGFTDKHPEERVEDAEAILSALYAQGLKIERVDEKEER